MSRPPREDGDNIADAIREVFVSGNVLDSNWEPANLVDVVQRVADALNRLAAAVEESNK
jgi:hypothetical protein